MNPLSTEEKNLLRLFGESFCANDSCDDACEHMLPEVEKFIALFDRDPIRWRTEIAPPREPLPDGVTCENDLYGGPR